MKPRNLVSIFVVVVLISLFACTDDDDDDATPTPTAIPTDTTFSNTYGGNCIDRGFCVKQFENGDFIICGMTTSYNATNNDVLLIRTDEYGNEKWAKNVDLGGTEEGYSMQVIDGCFVVCGFSLKDANIQIFAFESDGEGNIVWSNTFGSENRDFGYFISTTHEDGFIICGSSTNNNTNESDIIVTKIDHQGNEIWTKYYGGSKADSGHMICKASDNSYALIGNTELQETGDYDIYLLKIDSVGNEIWSKTYGGLNVDLGTSIEVTADGGFILGGFTYSYSNGKSDAYIIKTDNMGNVLWDNHIGGLNADSCEKIISDDNRGYTLVGSTYSFGSGSGDMYLVKLDIDGNVNWSKTFGGSNLDVGYFIQKTLDGGYVLCGWTESYGNSAGDVYLIKTDENGEI